MLFYILFLRCLALPDPNIERCIEITVDVPLIMNVSRKNSSFFHCMSTCTAFIR